MLIIVLDVIQRFGTICADYDPGLGLSSTSCVDGEICYDPRIEAARAEGRLNFTPMCVDSQRSVRIHHCSDADEDAPSGSTEEICADNCSGCYSDDGFLCRNYGRYL